MKRIAGFDNRGAVYDDGSRIRRLVDPGYLSSALKVYEALRDDLARLGVVDTEYDAERRGFTHKKHIISYPHEWTAGMLKDAALFHLELLRELDARGMTLKDALPSNILFDFTRPVFVDFLSIVRTADLDKEDWLVGLAGRHAGDLRAAVMKSMYKPYFLVPLLEMGRRQYRVARTQLRDQACNAGNGTPKLPGRGTPRRVLDLCRAAAGIRNSRTAETMLLLSLKRLLAGTGGRSFVTRVERLQRRVGDLRVTPGKSAYSQYYHQKHEDFDLAARSAWKPKQVNTLKVLEQTRPGRVLDIGANTGWYSLLAAEKGAEVIALDVDEASIETLYQRSRHRNLRILSLNIPFDQLEMQTPAAGGQPTDAPLFARATERVRSELVLCLGLLHHLVLGQGRSLDKVLATLDSVTARTLVLEFVGRDDPLVRSEPSFFPQMARLESDYDLNAVISAARKRFASHSVLESNPTGRKLLVLEK